ncbi:MAG: rRNA cytosine-C5-methyltransferase [Bacteroidales bacterium]|jgi:16S rRNA C967 or C1407 C5-methylase (RsmB/RsmF family)/NOL1/NOP2/fmu family ribosome biogenesis protein
MKADFLQTLTSWLPEAEVNDFITSINAAPPVSIRQHARKAKGELFPGSPSIPWYSRGRYLDSRPVFTLDPRFHAGAYYVQEASGISVGRLEPLLAAMDAPRVLDACASPGGKSTLLLDILPDEGFLVSNETIQSRIPALTDNIARWGYGNVMVTGNDPSAFRALEGYFDVILADVPCSGEGLFRKDKTAAEAWSAGLVNLCAARQRRILTDLWPALRQGGLLLYSTCTFNTQENEEQVSWIENVLGGRIVWPPERFLPHRIQGEGFFMALLEKTSASAKKPLSGKFAHTVQKKQAPENFPKPLHGHYTYSVEEGLLKAVPSQLAKEWASLEKHLHVVHSGIAVAVQKGKDWVPHPDLALANDLKQDAFPRLCLTRAEAIAFLRKENIVCPPHLEKGYVLVTYDGYPLGFIKNLGHRTNNLFPKSRKILMHPVAANKE